VLVRLNATSRLASEQEDSLDFSTR